MGECLGGWQPCQAGPGPGKDRLSLSAGDPSPDSEGNGRQSLIGNQLERAQDRAAPVSWYPQALDSERIEDSSRKEDGHQKWRPAEPREGYSIAVGRGGHIKLSGGEATGPNPTKPGPPPLCCSVRAAEWGSSEDFCLMAQVAGGIRMVWSPLSFWDSSG